ILKTLLTFTIKYSNSEKKENDRKKYGSGIMEAKEKRMKPSAMVAGRRHVHECSCRSEENVTV
ncbi:hypothetical protein Bpfe_022767, partial [Biomphalaria pfeifferi]